MGDGAVVGDSVGEREGAGEGAFVGADEGGVGGVGTGLHEKMEVQAHAEAGHTPLIFARHSPSCLQCMPLVMHRRQYGTQDGRPICMQCAVLWCSTYCVLSCVSSRVSPPNARASKNSVFMRLCKKVR
jgi:hypothetical protein